MIRDVAQMVPAYSYFVSYSEYTYQTLSILVLRVLALPMDEVLPVLGSIPVNSPETLEVPCCSTVFFKPGILRVWQYPQYIMSKIWRVLAASRSKKPKYSVYTRYLKYVLSAKCVIYPSPFFTPVGIQHNQCPCRSSILLIERYLYTLCGHKTMTEFLLL